MSVEFKGMHPHAWNRKKFHFFLLCIKQNKTLLFFMDYNASWFTPELSIMHWCLIKERNKNTSFWSCLTNRVVILLHNPSMFCPLSVAWIWICTCWKSCLVNLSLCLLYELCACHISCIGLSLTDSFALYLLKCTESITWWRNRILLKKSLTEFYKGLSHWLQLNPTDPDNKHHCLSTNNHKLLSAFMVDFRKLLSTSVFAALRKWHTCITLGQGHGRIYNLRFQLYISFSCKSWLHGKSKASKVGCYIVLLKAGKQCEYTVG